MAASIRSPGCSKTQRETFCVEAFSGYITEEDNFEDAISFGNVIGTGSGNSITTQWPKTPPNCQSTSKAQHDISAPHKRLRARFHAFEGLPGSVDARCAVEIGGCSSLSVKHSSNSASSNNNSNNTNISLSSKPVGFTRHAHFATEQLEAIPCAASTMQCLNSSADAAATLTNPTLGSHKAQQSRQLMHELYYITCSRCSSSNRRASASSDSSNEEVAEAADTAAVKQHSELLAQLAQEEALLQQLEVKLFEARGNAAARQCWLQHAWAAQAAAEQPEQQKQQQHWWQCKAKQQKAAMQACQAESAQLQRHRQRLQAELVKLNWQVRTKQCQREELQQQLLAVSCPQGQQQPSSRQLQQLLLAASTAALQKSITRVSSQVEVAGAEYVAAKEEYVSAAGKAAGVLLECNKDAQLRRSMCLLQMASSNRAAAQQIRELLYFKAEMQEQKFVVTAKVERLQQELLGFGVVTYERHSSGGSAGSEHPCVSRQSSSSSSSSRDSNGCTPEQLTRQLCAALERHRAKNDSFQLSRLPTTTATLAAAGAAEVAVCFTHHTLALVLALDTLTTGGVGRHVLSDVSRVLIAWHVMSSDGPVKMGQVLQPVHWWYNCHV